MPVLSLVAMMKPMSHVQRVGAWAEIEAGVVDGILRGDRTDCLEKMTGMVRVAPASEVDESQTIQEVGAVYH